MTRDQRRFLLIALLVTFMAASDRLVRFYNTNVPVAQVGHCVKFDFIDHSMIGKVLTNDFENGTCLLQLNYEGMTETNEMSYSDLRYLDAKEVDCETNY